MAWLNSFVFYGDAAGHPRNQHAMSVGGYVATLPAWERFSHDWQRVLKPHGIEVFHMADFMACGNGYKHWLGKHDEKAKLLNQLVGVIEKHTREGFATLVLLDSWRRVNQIYALDKNHCTPYALAGLETMKKIIRWLNRRQRDFRARFIFEDGDEHKGDFMWLVDELIARKKILAGFKPHFEQKGELKPLEAADFAMWEQVRNVKDQLENPDTPPVLRQSLKRLMELKSKWGYMNEDHMLSFCRDYDVPKRGEKRAWSFHEASRRRALGGGQS